MPGSDAQQPSFADVEYGNRRRRTRRDEFLGMMVKVIPWDEWTGLVVPFYPTTGRRGRQPVPVETMLRMYLLQVWFSLSDEGTEDAIYDSSAFCTFMGLDFTRAQVPDATTILHFRHLIEEQDLGAAFLEAQTRFFESHGWIMRGGSVIDATIINAPSSTKNAAGARDPEMHQTAKGNQWFFGLKAHTGADAGTGYVHTVRVTAANASDITQAANLVRGDDEVGYADSGYQGVQKRPEITGDERLARIEWRVAARKSRLKAMPAFDQQLESRKASVRAKVEHPYLIVKRDFGFTKTRYRGLAKNHNLLKRARAVRL
ncbi:IS5 family transposase [Leekyejoonella antrihumi]|uniref:IS5 family transposase n=1 Tax=Leekyejoonella antrihumi TaxID=1660198 RepID=A0A563E5A6_9MICO|nr:IS5 family transposase [Leekyejoonella antrihumi]TWP37402.1 IS5 family transposase [Leekyejoonella antrihumi]